MADGHLNKCKECAKLDSKRHRRDNIEACREYDRKRAKEPARAAKIVDRVRAFVRDKPTARWAHIKTGNAIRDGRLVKQPCEVCGVRHVVAHHDDYLKPLEVRWLCQPHHVEWHIANGPGANYDAPIPGEAA